MPLRYAILHHTGIAAPHFDLMFETHAGSDLATWRSSTWPIQARTELTRLTDHRRAYLEFEGELTQRRGRVERLAGGTCSVEIGADAVWLVRLLTGCTAQSLVFHPRDADEWIAEPANP
jgi:hypothetical protein